MGISTFITASKDYARMDSLYSTHVEIAKISENLLTWSKYDYT
jgi:hypothetical protein